MSFSGEAAVKLLDTPLLQARCQLHRKDNTDKMWSYRLVAGSHREFAFDPRTTKSLTVRLDTKPPTIEGMSAAKDISKESVSTALRRVFSGGEHQAKWKVTVETESAFLELIRFLESA